MSLCDQFLPDLCAWIDGELEDSQALEAHLATCASCRARVEEYRKLDAMIASVEPPAALHQHIMQGVNNVHSPKAKRRFAFGSATAVAAAAAVLVLAIGSGWISLPHFGQNAAAPAALSAIPNDMESLASSPTGGDGMRWDAAADSAAPADMPDMNSNSVMGDTDMDRILSDTDADMPAVDQEILVKETGEPTEVDSISEFVETASPNFSIATNNTAPDVSYGIVDGNDEDGSQILLWYIYDYQPNTLPEDFAQQFDFLAAEDGGYCADTDFDTLMLAYSDYYNLLGGDLYGKARVEAAEGETDQVILMPKYTLTLSPSTKPTCYWITIGYSPDNLPDPFADLDFTYTSTGLGESYVWVAQTSFTHFCLMMAAEDYTEVGGYIFNVDEAETCYIILLPEDIWTKQLVWMLYDVDFSDLPDEMLVACEKWDFQEDENRWSTTMDATTLFGLYLRYGGQLGGELRSSEIDESSTGVLTLYS